jgi:acetolactate synthase-1/2/3 large subunit
MRVSNYIANFLAQQGVREIFMLSGTGSIYLDDAFAHQRDMKYVCARHEAAAVIMAEAVAKLTGNIGVVVSTTGPGATNAAAGVVEAWVDSVPVMVISGQVSSSEISTHDRTFGIQGFDIVSHVESITKYSVTVLDPESIRYHLEKAVHSAMTGRPGPVWLDIPMDIQSSQISPDDLIGFIPDTNDYCTFDNLDDKLDEFIKLLSSSAKPVVIFGQGIRISRTISEFKNLIELLDIPAVSARMAKDILSYSHRNYIGMGGYKGQVPPAKILKESDLILSLGTSHSVSFPVDDNSKLICVNIDENILKKDELKIDLSIHANLKDFIPLAIARIKKSNLNYSHWMRKCLKIKEENPVITGEHLYNPINSYYLLNRLDENSSERHIFVNDAGSANYVSSQTLKLEHGQREITSGAFYSMGLAIPLAIGAASCMPESQIITVTGDGSIELNLQEIQTINLNNLNIKVFVINNGGYASIRESQDSMCGGRYTDDEEILNFSKVADTFNMPFYFIDDYQKLDEQIEDIFSIDGPALIEVLCDPNQNILSPYEVEGNV